MQEDIDHIAGTLFYSYTNIPPCDIGEVIQVMGGEGRAGVWLGGNCPTSGVFGERWNLDAVRREQLQADAKLSNTELIERYSKPLPTTTREVATPKGLATLDSVKDWLVPTPIHFHLGPFVEEFSKILEVEPKFLEVLALTVDTKLNAYNPSNSRPSLAERARACLSVRHAEWFLKWVVGLPDTPFNDQVILPLLLLEVVELERNNKDCNLTEWETGYLGEVITRRCVYLTEADIDSLSIQLRLRILATVIKPDLL